MDRTRTQAFSSRLSNTTAYYFQIESYTLQGCIAFIYKVVNFHSLFGKAPPHFSLPTHTTHARTHARTHAHTHTHTSYLGHYTESLKPKLLHTLNLGVCCSGKYQQLTLMMLRSVSRKEAQTAPKTMTFSVACWCIHTLVYIHTYTHILGESPAAKD